MRIDYPDNLQLNTLTLRPPQPQTAGTERHRTQVEARDSYTSNAENAAVLDADYVDTGQGRQTAKQQPDPARNNRISLELYALDSFEQQTSGSDPNTPVGRYQAMAALDLPAPGTYLSLFA